MSTLHFLHRPLYARMRRHCAPSSASRLRRIVHVSAETEERRKHIDAAYNRLLHCAGAAGEQDFGIKKRAVLTLGRSHESALDNLPSSTLVALARAPLPSIAKSGQRKEINAVKRLRLQVTPNEDPPASCVAAAHSFAPQGSPGLSDALRVFQVHAECVKESQLPSEAATSLVASVCALAPEEV